jgi:glycosyltransferase involved in cell wall biosynthesis
MAMGIPIVCNQGVGDTSELVLQYESGYVMNDLEEKSFSVAIEQMKGIKWSKEKIREGAIQYFGLENGIQSYLRAYSKCLN